MTTLTYSREDVDLVNRWLDARENEKRNVRVYQGDRPCLPAAALLAVCRRIFNHPTKKQP
jgi:hypothetical protein